MNGTEWSSYRCIGVPWYYHTLKPKVFRTNCRPTCILKNVCYSSDQKALMFHRKDSKRPLLFDGKGKAYFEFPGSSFSFRGLPIKVLDSPVPQPAHDTKVHVVVQPPSYYGQNYGHIFWSWIVPISSLFHSFGVSPSDAHIALAPGNEQSPPSPYDAYAKYLSPNPVQRLDSDSADAAGKNRSKCYASLILADMTCEDRKKQFSGARPTVPDFFERVYKFASGGTGAPPKPSRRALITVLRKRGKRAPINHDEMVAFLSREFTGAADVLTLDVSNTSIAMQLETLARTTILVSPSGGIAMAAPFLPPGSIIVQFGFYAATIGASYDYDALQLAEFAHISTVIFPVRRDELDPKTCSYSVDCGGRFFAVNSKAHRECAATGAVVGVDPQIKDWGEFVYCSFTVDLFRLRHIVAEALSNWGLFHGIKRRRHRSVATI